MGLFGGNKHNDQPEGITWDPDAPTPTQEEYEDFMNGFRRGCPVESDPEPVIPDEPSGEYLRGLECGQSAKADFDKSTRPWWKLW